MKKHKSKTKKCQAVNENADGIWNCLKKHKSKIKKCQAIKENADGIFILCIFVSISIIMLKFVKFNVKVVNQICTKVISLVEVSLICMQEKATSSSSY